MKKCFIVMLIFLGSFINSSKGQDSVKILFIGNSFTAANDLSSIVREFFQFDLTKTYTYAYAPGGISVGDVAQGTAAHMYNPLVFQLIRETDWNYVVLQDNQGRFALDSAIFPPISSYKVIEGHLKIRDSLHYYHSCAKMIWFSGWGPKDADFGASWIKKITTNYKVMNATAKDVIAPIGAAWKNATLSIPPMVDLWSGDDTHPNASGSYLTAAIIYGLISQKDVRLNKFEYTLPTFDANMLKNIAQNTLTDPIISKSSNTKGINPLNLTWDIVKGKLKGESGKLSYQWYLNTTLVATTTDSFYTPAKSGRYRLWSLDAAGYWQKSCAVDVPITSGIEQELLVNEDVLIFPNPASDLLNISTENTAIKSIEIYSLIGQKLLVLDLLSKETNVDISSLNSGVYFIKCLDKYGNLNNKVIKFIKS